MAKFGEMDTPGNRLRRALEDSGLSKSKFMEELAPKLRARRIPGTSMPALYRYLEPVGTPPTQPWLEEAAKILGVRAEWLEKGTGPRTDAEAALRPDPKSVETGVDAHVVSLEDIWTPTDYMLDGAPELLRRDDWAVLNALALVIARILEARELDPTKGPLVRDVAQELETAVLAALEPTGREPDRPSILAILAAIESALDRK